MIISKFSNCPRKHLYILVATQNAYLISLGKYLSFLMVDVLSNIIIFTEKLRKSIPLIQAVFNSVFPSQFFIHRIASISYCSSKFTFWSVRMYTGRNLSTDPNEQNQF